MHHNANNGTERSLRRWAPDTTPNALDAQNKVFFPFDRCLPDSKSLLPSWWECSCQIPCPDLVYGGHHPAPPTSSPPRCSLVQATLSIRSCPCAVFMSHLALGLFGEARNPFPFAALCLSRPHPQPGDTVRKQEGLSQTSPTF